jgi:acetylglutamate kinase
MEELIAKANVLLEALPWLQKWRGAIFVVKYGGSFMDSSDPAVREGVARDIVFLAAAGLRPVVVHGGGKAITRAMESAGLQARFIQGQRVTDERTVQVVEQVLSGEINPEIVRTLERLGGAAQGFAGSAVFTCRKLGLTGPGGETLDAGFIGETTGVRTEAVLDCLRAGKIPVISPTARDAAGLLHNCNADVAAAQTAMALRASRLIFTSDVPGLLRDPKDPATVMAELRPDEVDGLKKAGIIDKGMIPKVDSAVAAAQAGVGKVVFVDGRVPHSLLLEIFSAKPIGTTVGGLKG